MTHTISAWSANGRGVERISSDRIPHMIFNDTGKLFSPQEDAIIISQIAAGASYAVIGRKLGRSGHGVRGRYLSLSE